MDLERNFPTGAAETQVVYLRAISRRLLALIGMN